MERISQDDVLRVIAEFYPYPLHPKFIAKVIRINDGSVFRNISRLREKTPYLRMLVVGNKAYYTLSRKAIEDLKESGFKELGKKAKEIEKYGNEGKDFISFSL